MAHTSPYLTFDLLVRNVLPLCSTIGGLTIRAHGRLDSHCQISFIVVLGFVRFVSKSRTLQPPVSHSLRSGTMVQAVKWLGLIQNCYLFYDFYSKMAKDY
jgi:hypothetical protein